MGTWTLRVSLLVRILEVEGVGVRVLGFRAATKQGRPRSYGHDASLSEESSG